MVKLNNGLELPDVGFGVYLTPKGEAKRCVLDALEAGYRHIDSATVYRNEQESAEGILAFLEKNPNVSRKDIFFTSKMWADDFGYEKGKQAIEASLEKVKGLGYIDLYLLHTPAPGKELRLGAYKAMQEAVAEGKIKSIGVSNYGIHHIKELLEWDGLKVKPVVNQIEINPWLQRKEIADYCRQNGIVVEAYSPLMRGQRLDDPQLVSVAEKYKKSVAQILIKWSLQMGFVPLPKSVTPERIKSNIDLDFEMSPEDVKALGDPSAYFVTVPRWDPSTLP